MPGQIEAYYIFAPVEDYIKSKPEGYLSRRAIIDLPEGVEAAGQNEAGEQLICFTGNGRRPSQRQRLPIDEVLHVENVIRATARHEGKLYKFRMKIISE